jgi:hypothetical protein
LAWRQSRRPSWRIESIAVLAGGGAAWAAVTRVMPVREAVAVTVGVAFVMVVYGVARRRDLRVVAAWAWASWLVFGAASLVWGWLFLAGLDVSACTRVLLWAGVPFVVIGLPASVVTQRESLEVLLRRRWRHQATPLRGPTAENAVFVSIQVRVMRSRPTW